jgi:predicted GTPase
LEGGGPYPEACPEVLHCLEVIMENSGKNGNFDILDLIKNFNFNEKVKEKMRDMQNLNIVNNGKTGAGKSTLIDDVFGKETAKTGAGMPVIRHFESCMIGNSPITIYEPREIETGGYAIKDPNEIYYLISRQNTSDSHRQYHLYWYCVNAEELMIDPSEIAIIKRIRTQIFIILIITQFSGSDYQKEFFEKIRCKFDDQFPIRTFHEISQFEFGDMSIIMHSMERLVKRSYGLLSDSVKATFVAYQKTNVQLKINAGMDELKNVTRNINMEVMKNEWKENKGGYLQFEIEKMLHEAKKSLE